MSTQQTGAPESGSLTLDAFVDELDAPVEAIEEDEQQAAPDGEDVAEDVDAVEADADDDELEAAEDEDDADKGPQLPPPQSWAKDDHAAWAALPKAAQEIVSKREADRDRAVAEAASKAGRAAAQVRELAQGYDQVQSQITDDLTRAATEWQRVWGNVDWPRYARENPHQYNIDKAQAEQERQDIAAYAQHLEGVKHKAAKSAAAAREAFLAEEWTKLAELSPELSDPKDGPGRRKEAIEYLTTQGFTPDVLADISAVELTLARKAMLWDNAQKAAKQQASIPRRNPANIARAVPSGAGAAVATPKRNLQAASQRLTKSGSIDDFVNLLNAEQEAKTRKGRRP